MFHAGYADSVGGEPVVVFYNRKYGNTIDELTFEVRSIDGTRLVEKTKVTDYQENDKSISASITIKDLIEQNTEYNWILLVTTQSWRRQQNTG